MVNKQGGASSGSKRKPFVAATTTEEDYELNKSTAFIETGSDTINKSEFETIIKKYIKQCENNLKGLIKSENAALKSEIFNNHQKIESLQDENSNLKKLAELNKSSIDALKEESASLKAKLARLEGQHESLAEEVEERTNRQLRKTLVFRGIPEHPIPMDPSTADTGARKENWEETEKLLAKKIAEVCEDTTLEDARSMIERAHRARPNPNYKGPAPRLIFAAFYDWKSSEYVKKQFRYNSKDFHCDSKYGRRTTARRNLALKERARLKD